MFDSEIIRRYFKKARLERSLIGGLRLLRNVLEECERVREKGEMMNRDYINDKGMQNIAIVKEIVGDTWINRKRLIKT